MKNKSYFVTFVLSVVILVTLSGCGYNTMQKNEEAVKAAWGDVEAAYQRRNDLIPNLVEVVKAYAKHERETLTAVTEARARVGAMQVPKNILDDPKAFSQFQEAQAGMSSALSRLMVVVERYPDLKANQNFQDLQRQLADTEDKISYARNYYNAKALQYNSLVSTFPSLLVAGVGGFKEVQFFDAPEAAEQDVNVSFRG